METQSHAERHLSSAKGRVEQMIQAARAVLDALATGKPLAQVTAMLLGLKIDAVEAARYIESAQLERESAEDQRLKEIARVEKRDTEMRAEAAIDNRLGDAVKSMATGEAPAAWAKRDDLAMPAGLSSRGEQAWKTIRAFLKETGRESTGGCRAFYSPKEWAARGEEYGLKSELVVVYDGGEHRGCFNCDDGDGKEAAQLDERLAKVGLYVEECTGWYAAVYPI